jgi:hypothetical protein
MTITKLVIYTQLMSVFEHMEKHTNFHIILMYQIVVLTQRNVHSRESKFNCFYIFSEALPDTVVREKPGVVGYV